MLLHQKLIKDYFCFLSSLSIVLSAGGHHEADRRADQGQTALLLSEGQGGESEGPAGGREEKEEM